MELQRRRFLSLAAGAAALPALPRSACALDYPVRPVRIVVPYPAAIAPDIVARLVAQALSQQFKQQFIVDNRPGGASNVGTSIVAHAPADGYTLLVVTATTPSTPRSTRASISTSPATLRRLRASFGYPSSW